MADRSLTLVFLGKDVSAGATAEALAAKLKVLEAAQDDNAKSADKLTRSLDNTTKSGFKPLLDTALLVGPALVPIAAAAVAAGAGLAGMGAVGVLAFAGIKREMQQGTTLGLQYRMAFAPVVDEFHQLEHVAAANVFGGINKGIKETMPLWPLLESDVAKLSTSLGDIAGHVASGLVGLFHQLNPLFVSLAGDLDKGAVAFDHWANSSDGPKRFVAYAQAQLPVVEGIVKNLATSIMHIAEAAAPLGGATLQAFSALAAVIARIPVPILTGFLLALEVGRLAQIAGGITGIANAFGLLSSKAGGAASAIGLVPAPLLAIGVAVAGLTFGIDKLVSALDKGDLNFDKISKSAQVFGSALDTTNGKINESVIRSVALQLQQTGVAEKAAKAGVSLTQLTQAVTGNDQQMNALIGTLQKGGNANKSLEMAVISLHAQFGGQQAAAAALGQTVNQLSADYQAVPRNVQTYLRGIDQASGVIRGVDGLLRTLDGRVVYTTIVTQHSDIYTVSDAAANRGPAGVTSHATGGFLTEGWNRINEMGPEWLWKSGSQVQVYPTGTGGPTGVNGGTVINVALTVNGTVTSEQNLVSAVRAGIRQQLRSEGKTATVI